MANLLIIGAGGVGRVAAFKCAQYDGFFDTICLASRSVEKSCKIQEEIGSSIEVEQLDADDGRETEKLIRKYRADVVINAALPYQNLKIMEACLAKGAHYIDTAVCETADELWHDPHDRYWYGLQWNYRKNFADKGLTAILGIGSDPGIVNVFCSYAEKELFDKILSIDILDVNAGNHGFPFATNFNPEINLRELQNPSYYWEHGKWRKAEAFSTSREFFFPEIGSCTVFSMDHDEIHSLYKHFPEAEHIRFWMGFRPRFIDYFNKLSEIGLLSIDPVEVETEGDGRKKVMPLKFLKEVLPDPASLGKSYRGKVCIGCLIKGRKDGREQAVFIYNLCDHQASFRQTGAQAISFIAGVPPAIAAILLIRGEWRQPGVYNAEQLDPYPFMDLLPQFDLPWDVRQERSPGLQPE